ncbi:hypothetical protein E2C01_045417 [Portunus trituberculatus]|uniref:Uncharacterized protein n=1 Tax=Portunus trituberculatus TaxID=210409 RepID=A0A5B7G352_PORTR|nr:hypothetical protein [Portunus trituberculatus]
MSGRGRGTLVCGAQQRRRDCGGFGVGFAVRGRREGRRQGELASGEGVECKLRLWSHMNTTTTATITTQTSVVVVPGSQGSCYTWLYGSLQFLRLRMGCGALLVFFSVVKFPAAHRDPPAIHRRPWFPPSTAHGERLSDTIMKP